MLNFKIEAKFANSNLSAQLIFVLSILFCIKFQMIALSLVGGVRGCYALISLSCGCVSIAQFSLLLHSKIDSLLHRLESLQLAFRQRERSI